MGNESVTWSQGEICAMVHNLSRRHYGIDGIEFMDAHRVGEAERRFPGSDHIQAWANLLLDSRTPGMHTG